MPGQNTLKLARYRRHLMYLMLLVSYLLIIVTVTQGALEAARHTVHLKPWLLSLKISHFWGRSSVTYAPKWRPGIWMVS